ncbi:hypothetical protein PIB30_089575 [Stylosanthes scabra]|uniref:Uncharacterized protein n=1 Tax=Stylosanthes scabra TaxID=79078 RepID=A0ABU6VUC0_9FABA|nr:hypothetical protein [Stylosanthes scabra]
MPSNDLKSIVSNDECAKQLKADRASSQRVYERVEKIRLVDYELVTIGHESSLEMRRNVDECELGRNLKVEESRRNGRLGLSEKLDAQPLSRILRQPSKLEPVPEKFDNVRSENLQPMDSQYGYSANPTIFMLAELRKAFLFISLLAMSFGYT